MRYILFCSNSFTCYGVKVQTILSAGVKLTVLHDFPTERWISSFSELVARGIIEIGLRVVTDQKLAVGLITRVAHKTVDALSSCEIKARVHIS